MGILDIIKDKKPQNNNGKKNLDYILIFVVIVIVGLLYFSSFFGQMTFWGSNKTASVATSSISSSSSGTDLEKKLKDVLSKIEGAGEVEVMITYETSAEIVPAVSVDETTSTTTSSSGSNGNTSETKSTSTKPLTVDNSVLVLVEKEPVIKGVIVVAEGAGDIKTKLALQRAVQTVLNIDSSNIDIFTMKK